MLIAYNGGRKDTRSRIQRIHGRVDSQLGNLTAQYVVASRWAKVVAGAGSVRSSAGT